MMPIAHYQALGRKLEEARSSGDAKSVAELESQLRKAPVVIRYAYVGDVRPPLPPEAPPPPADLLEALLDRVCPERAERSEPAPPADGEREQASSSVDSTGRAKAQRSTTMVSSRLPYFDDCMQRALTLAARLVGRYDAEDITREVFQSLAKRLVGRQALEASSPEKLWKLTCKVTVLRSYHHLRRRELAKQAAVAGRVLSPTGELDRAHDSLPPVLRIAHVLQRYYGYEDGDFQEMLRLPERQGRVLADRANRALKRAMEMK